MEIPQVQKHFASAATTTTGEWPPHEDGDLLGAITFLLVSSSTVSIPDTIEGDTSAHDGTVCAVHYVEADSGGMTEPVATHSSCSRRSMITFNLGSHAVATTPVDTAAINTGDGGGTVTKMNSIATTTNFDRCLVLQIAAEQNTNVLNPEPGPTLLFAEINGGLQMAAAYTIQETADAVDSFEWWLTRGSNGIHGIVLPIRLDTGINPARLDFDAPCAEALLVETDRDSAGANPVTDGATGLSTIDGVTVAAPSQVGFLGGGARPLSYVSGPRTNADGVIGCLEFVFVGGAVNVGSRPLIFHPAVGSAEYTSRITDLANYGVVLIVRSSTNEYDVFRALGIETAANETRGIVIDNATGVPVQELNGGADWADITAVGMGIRRNSSSEVRGPLGNVFALNPIVIVGGDSVSGYAGWETAYIGTRSIPIRSVEKLGAAYQFKQGVQIGNLGTNVVQFKTAGKTFSAAPQASLADKDVTFQSTPIPVELQTVSGDLCHINDPVNLEGGTFSIHASATNAGDYDFLGGLLLKVGAWSIGADIGVITGLTITNSVELALSSLAADFDLSGGCTIRNGTGTHDVSVSGATAAAIQADIDLLANCTIGNFHISSTFTGDIAVEWDNITVTGVTTYSSTQASSEITITMSNGASSASNVATDDETFNIVAPILTMSINSDTASTLLRYFENDSQTVVDSATGVTLDYEYPDTDVVDIEAVKQGYVPVNRQDVIPIDGDFDLIMDFDEAYNASHGLSITSQYDYTRSTKALTINSDQSALDVRSSLADVIRTNSSYYNTKLLMVAIPGLTRVDLTEGMTITSMATWKGAGMERFDAADSANPVEKWLAVKSVGGISGASAYCRQTDSGDATAVSLTGLIIDEAFQYYRDDNHDGDTSDTDEYDYSDYLLIKTFDPGYRQGRVDVLANAGVSALSSNLYTVPLTNVAHGYSGTDPGISADLTLIAGGTEGGKVFSFEWVDGGTNTGSDIADQINYNAATNPNAVIPGGTGLRYFELPDMVIHNATNVETERGYREGTTPTQVGFYVSRGGADHPDFTQFQADDGTYYVPAVLLQSSITNLLADDSDRILSIYNLDTATQVYKGVAGTAYSATYTEGGDYTAGDQVRIRWAQANGTTSFKSFSTVVTATASGWTLDASNVITENLTYANLGIDGPAVTGHTADHTDDEADLTAGANFDGRNTQAWLLGVLATSDGIDDFWGGYTIGDGYIQIHNAVVNMNLDNTTSDNIRETQNIKIFRDDGAYPVKGLGNGTSGGGGITVRHLDPIYTIASGSVSQATLDEAVAQSTGANTKASDNNRLLKNRQDTNPDTGVMTVYADDDTTPLYEADLSEDVGGTEWTGTNPIFRRDRLVAP